MTLAEPGQASRPLSDIFDALSEDGRLVHIEQLPARPARFARLRHPLPSEIAEALGFGELWTHQAEAINRIRSGESVVVATGTASGKSLCFQVPMAELVTHAVRPGTSLALFPTKALAHDQLRAITQLQVPKLVAATYDGDSSREERAWVRDNANALFTNPEMVHGSLLPHHKRWADFLMRLQLVVIDELHIFRGVFGTHLAHVLRRLRRICLRYGADPTFVFCSATIGEPSRLASQLCGLPVAEISDDGSPQGPRTFALLNPPVVDREVGTRTSANAETASVAAAFMSEGHRTIAFCRSRKGTELVAADISRRLPDDPNAVRSYRSGYLAEERRDIEDELAAGSLKGVVATSALELGVDIGGLDACVLNGYPGTISSLWQQAGRAGRREQHAAAVLVAGDDQLDQWIMQNPTELFSRKPEPAVINPSNPYILNAHLACAAFEAPITHDDERFWGDDLHEGVRDLVQADQLAVRPRRREPIAVWNGDGFPSRGIGLRNGSSGQVNITHIDGTPIGTVDSSRASGSVHPGAIYLHRGRSYRVLELDLVGRVAFVEPYEGDEYTQARSDISIGVLGIDETKRVGRSTLHLGRVEVVSQVTGFDRKEIRSRRLLGRERLDLPPDQLDTRAFWYVFDDDLIVELGLDNDRLPGTLHAAEHTAIGMLPLFTICDRWDVGGVSIAAHPHTGGPTVFIHDGYPGGAGIAELGYEASTNHLQMTLTALEQCACTEGCPSCVQSPKCGNGNEPLDKAGALTLLTGLLQTT